MQFTPDQQAVIDTREKNILVSAAAGSGKTAVLVERILRRVLDPDMPVDIDRLLVVTFTKAAAAEMRERIRMRLEREALAHPLDERLQKQLNLVHSAHITTIDSFCSRVVRDNFDRIGLDPGSRIGNQPEIELLKEDAADELMEEAYEEGSEEFLSFLEHCSFRKDDLDVRQQILDLHQYAESRVDPEKWLNELPVPYINARTSPVDEQDWALYFSNLFLHEIEEIYHDLQKAQSLAEDCAGPYMYLDAVESDMDMLSAFLSGNREDEDPTSSEGGLVTELKESGEAILELKEDVEAAPELKEAGEAVLELKEDVEAAPELKEAGEAVSGIKEDGEAVSESKETGEAVSELKEAGEAVSELKEAGGGSGKTATGGRKKSLLTYTEIRERLNNLSFQRLSSKKDKDVDPDIKEMVKNIRNGCKDRINKLSEYFRRDLDEAIAEITVCAPLIEELVRLTLRFRQIFTSLKEKKNVMDFSDLEHFAATILKGSAGEEYRDYFQEIMTDEYQDSNHIQEAILTSIAKDNNYFCVGDVKQSIYSFRLAEPEIFLSRYESYDRDPKSRKIVLSKNFRSRKSVIKSVNDVFRRVMHPTVGGVEYDRQAELYYGASYLEDLEENGTELLLLEKDSEGEIEPLELEARAVAEKIGKMVGSFPIEERGSGERRPAEYGDFVILLRTITGVDEVYRKALEEAGIPAYVESATGYFQTEEVRTVCNFISILDNPVQDIALTAVLKSPFGGFSDSELAGIRLCKEDGSFYEALKVAAGEPAEASNKAEVEGVDPAEASKKAEVEEGDSTEASNKAEVEDVDLAKASNKDEVETGELSEVSGKVEVEAGVLSEASNKADVGTGEDGPKGFPDKVRAVLSVDELMALRRKAASFLHMLERYRDMVPYTPIHSLIRRILNETGYDLFAATKGGSASGNLELLISRAAEYEETSYRGLFRFIRYIEQLKKRELDLGEAGSEEGGNAVRIMSIHKSKGLEFPVVFLCNLQKRFNFRDASAAMVTDPSLGIGLSYVEPDRKVKKTTAIMDAIACRRKLNTLGEEIRILYVAMTRAEEKLIMTAVVPDLEKALAYSGKGISGALSYLDLVLMAINDGEAAKSISVSQVPLFETVDEAVEEEIKFVSFQDDFLSVDPEKVYDGEVLDRLNKAVSYAYPYESSLHIPAKVSVSELKIAAMRDDEFDIPLYGIKGEKKVSPRLGERKTGQGEGSQELDSGIEPADRREGRPTGSVDEAGRVPDGRAADKIEGRPTGPVDEAGSASDGRAADKIESRPKGGAERGTAYHTAFERLPFGELHTLAEVEEYLNTLVKEERVSPEMAKRIRPKDILAFIKSPLAQRMQRAEEKGKLFQEQPFLIGRPASELRADYPEGEMVLIQGIIDAFFEEDGRIIVMDYKTDAVKDARTLVDRYHTQLDYYAQALNQLTGKQVAEKLIYSVALAKTIEL
ncbi:MAG: UvrD-helicase domain-containing protein [Lachnospiraceae bacterium]|nr:UvrD-helicase domain-containing protein [Lachnospiraceae bacterium]